jgi:hypothetical protein
LKLLGTDRNGLRDTEYELSTADSILRIHSDQI